jgi:hypothetical protein
MIIVDTEDLKKNQRTRAGIAWDRKIETVRELYRTNKKFREKADRAAREIYEQRAVIGPNTVHVNKLLSNLSIAYKNDIYIAESILGVVPVSQRSDTYLKWSRRNLLNAPDDLLGNRAKANEVMNEYTDDNYSLKDYGLKDYVDDQTMKNADQPFLEVLDMIEGLLERIALKRELRAAAVATAGASYSGNTLSLAGSEWNATTSGGMYTGGSPINNIRSALAAVKTGFGRTRKVGFTSLDVFNVLSNHSHIRGLFGLSDSGLATQQMIAKYFGLDELLVTEAEYDTANIGQSASYSRIWGNVFGVVRVAQTPSKRIAAFGSIFRQNGDPFVHEWYSPDEGKSGGHYAKVAISEDIKIVAPDTGYLLTNLLV